MKFNEYMNLNDNNYTLHNAQANTLIITYKLSFSHLIAVYPSVLEFQKQLADISK